MLRWQTRERHVQNAHSMWEKKNGFHIFGLWFLKMWQLSVASFQHPSNVSLSTKSCDSEACGFAGSHDHVILKQLARLQAIGVLWGPTGSQRRQPQARFRCVSHQEKQLFHWKTTTAFCGYVRLTSIHVAAIASASKAWQLALPMALSCRWL